MRLFHSYAPALHAKYNHLAPGPTPSDMVNFVSNQIKIFGADKTSIQVGRPGGAPAAIFNPVLAILRRRLEDLEKADVSVT